MSLILVVYCCTECLYGITSLLAASLLVFGVLQVDDDDVALEDRDVMLQA